MHFVLSGFYCTSTVQYRISEYWSIGILVHLYGMISFTGLYFRVNLTHLTALTIALLLPHPCRLREMLRREEQEYLAAMEAAEETTLERQAKMRERAKSLKEKREQERLQFVQDKYDQQFR